MFNEATLRVLVPDQAELEKFKSLVPEGHTPLWQYWEEFADYHIILNRSLYTLRNIRSALQFCMRHMDIYSIESLNRTKEFQKILFSLKKEKGMGESNLNSYLKNIKPYLKWLKKEGVIEQNALSEVDRFIIHEKEQQASSHEEVIKAVVHIEESRRQSELQRLRNIFLFNLFRFTAARPIEIVGLTTDCIVLKGKKMILKIQGKKQKGRIRYYQMETALKRSYLAYMGYRRQVGRDEEALIISCTQKGAITVSGIRCFFKRISKELGFRIVPYSIRRYVATRLSDKKLSMESIARFLGHTRPKITERYIERTSRLTEEGMDALLSLDQTEEDDESDPGDGTQLAFAFESQA